MARRLVILILVLATAGCTARDAAPPSPSPTATVERTDLPDGRHAAFINAVDVGNSALSVDVIQFLTGEEAVEAFREDTGETGDPENDYWIRNENDRLRTLSVSEDVVVRLVRMEDDANADLDPGTFEELPAYVEEFKEFMVFWLTLRDGEVVRIEEQFRP